MRHGIIVAAILVFLLTPPVAGDALADPDLVLARTSRSSVVRVRWRDARFSDLTTVRNAVVAAKDGLLLMAGPPPSRRGSLTAILADGRELRASVLASDARTALTLLRVQATGLRPLVLRAEPKDAPKPATPFPPRPLRLPPPGLRVLMVTGDGAVAPGVVRSWDRYGSVANSDSGRRSRSTGLVGVAMAGIDVDAGSPLLDADGRLVGLMVGRRAVVAPEKGRAAGRVGLKLRPEPVEVVAVPAAVIEIVRPLLEKVGRVPRAALGVTTEPVGEAVRQHLGLGPEEGGHVIRRLTAGGPAQQAKLAIHDIIVSLNGAKIRPGTSLHDVLLPFRPRTRVRVSLLRNGRPLDVPLTLGAR